MSHKIINHYSCCDCGLQLEEYSYSVKDTTKKTKEKYSQTEDSNWSFKTASTQTSPTHPSEMEITINLIKREQQSSEQKMPKSKRFKH